MLLWGMRRQICPAEMPAQGFVIRFDFRGIPKTNRSPRYWWLVLRTDDIEVCLKPPPDGMLISSSPLIFRTSPRCGSAILTFSLHSKAERSPSKAPGARSRRRVVCLHSPTNQSLRTSDFRIGPHPSKLTRSSNIAIRPSLKEAYLKCRLRVTFHSRPQLRPLSHVPFAKGQAWSTTRRSRAGPLLMILQQWVIFWRGRCPAFYFPYCFTLISGSACRCTTFHCPPSRRNTVVTLRASC